MTALVTSANKNVETNFLFVSDSAYICTARARGANHHFPTGSNAPLRRIPERIESGILTNLFSPT
jgi:hypothetical protein